MNTKNKVLCSRCVEFTKNWKKKNVSVREKSFRDRLFSNLACFLRNLIL